jgi:hypothetical protein
VDGKDNHTKRKVIKKESGIGCMAKETIFFMLNLNQRIIKNKNRRNRIDTGAKNRIDTYLVGSPQCITSQALIDLP